VALVRAEAEGAAAAAALIPALTALAAALPPSQRPRRWLACADLAPTALGKWQRAAWGRVLAGQG
jgi:uncharacterized membrane protein